MVFPTKRLLHQVRDDLQRLSHLMAFVLLTLLGARLWSNLRFLRWVRDQAAEPSVRLPRVSVLIPARNEAATISSCVTSLLQQRYPDLEVMVLDDGSTDGTRRQLEALKVQYPQLTVIHATGDPPPGWNGKSFACLRLAERATGDWLLFTDADTIHEPHSVAQGITQAVALDAALLSACPYQRTNTWSERLIVSFILDFMPLVALNFKAMWHGNGRQVVANGQYLLVHAASYRALGGHASIQSALIDDFALAQRFRTAGYTIALVDGTAMLSCRMYHTFREVWDGFSKNLLLALTSSSRGKYALWRAPLFAWCYACVFVLPFFNLVFSERKALARVEICGLFLVRGLAVRHLRRPLDEVLTTPLAAWGVMALGMGTLYRRWRKRPIAWKGRRY
jgi:chlorobactene glucosyltransferase